MRGLDGRCDNKGSWSNLATIFAVFVVFFLAMAPSLGQNRANFKSIRGQLTWLSMHRQECSHEAVQCIPKLNDENLLLQTPMAGNLNMADGCTYLQQKTVMSLPHTHTHTQVSYAKSCWVRVPIYWGTYIRTLHRTSAVWMIVVRNSHDANDNEKHSRWRKTSARCLSMLQQHLRRMIYEKL